MKRLTRRRSSPWTIALTVLLIGVGAGLAGWLILSAGSLRARPAYCIGVALAVVAAGALVRACLDPADPAARLPAAPADSPDPYADLYFLEYRLSWGSVERQRFEQRVRPLLVRLVDERLRQRHGIDPARDPDRARKIVGEQLWQLRTGTPTPGERPPTPREVAATVELIEAI